MQPHLTAGWLQCTTILLLVTLWISTATECPKTVRHQWEGIIESPQYPQPYPPDSCQQWDIRGNPEDIITLSFTDLNIPDDPQTCADSYLVIGPLPSRRICGSLNNSHPLVYISQTSHVSIRFYGSAKQLGRGFHLRYVRGRVPSRDRCFTEQWRCRNGKCILDQWHCNSADECGDGSDERACSEIHLPVAPSVNACGENQFGCLSHESRKYECHWSYRACDGHNDCLQGEDEAHCDHVSSCGGARGGSSGVIQSPNYPSHYPNNRTCVWPIIVEYGRQVQLRFRDFILQSRVNTDYVAVYDGDSQNSDMLGKYYAQGMAPKVLESSSNQMFVVFHSDGAHTYRGFHATYQIKGQCLQGQLSCGDGDRNCYEQNNQTCDGIWDCVQHGTDEKGCGGCASTLFGCGDKSRICYSEAEHCNGIAKCTNHQDELHCNQDQCGPHNGTFLCANGRCIYESWICDGTADCQGGDDEKDCTVTSVKVVTAAVIGTLCCALLLVVALGCLCKLYNLRLQDQSLQGLMWHPSAEQALARALAPPPYMEAMLTSRNYEEVQQELQSLATQQGHDTRVTPDDVPLLADTDLIQARSNEDEVLLELSGQTDNRNNPSAQTTSSQQPASHDHNKQVTSSSQSPSSTTITQANKEPGQEESNQSQPGLHKTTSTDSGDGSVARGRPVPGPSPSVVPGPYRTSSPAGLESSEGPEEVRISGLEGNIDTLNPNQQIS